MHKKKKDAAWFVSTLYTGLSSQRGYQIPLLLGGRWEIPLPLIISAFERWCQVVQKLQFDWICGFCRQRQINRVLHTGFDRIQAFNLPPSGSFSVFGPVRVLVAGSAGWQMETRSYLYVKSREKSAFQLPQSFVDPIFRDKPNHAGTTSRTTCWQSSRTSTDVQTRLILV